MATDPIRIERVTTDSKIFAHTRLDAIPILAALLHLAFFFALFVLYPHTPLWIMLLLGFTYALMVNANINGVSHNFIHNPYFRSPILNRIFGVIESIACCFSQTYYDVVHTQHHKGNRENPWSYVFLSFFRDNPVAIKRELKKRGETEVRWGNIELAAFATTLFVMFCFNWRYLIFFLPFFYLGHCFSYLNGYSAITARIRTNRSPGA